MDDKEVEFDEYGDVNADGVAVEECWKLMLVSAVDVAVLVCSAVYIFWWLGEVWSGWWRACIVIPVVMACPVAEYCLGVVWEYVFDCWYCTILIDIFMDVYRWKITGDEGGGRSEVCDMEVDGTSNVLLA